MEEKDALPKLGTEWDEDDDVDDDDNTTEQGQVMLGFVYEQGKEEEEEGNTYPPLFTTTDWMSWDGGKVGGKPIWLNRKDLPSVAAMECGVCGEIMKFLLQIYCPVDGIEEAFHRAIYVICCRKKACIERHCLKTRSVKVFRCQLPRNNQFYPYDSSEDGASVEDLPLWSTFPKVCRVCGFKATKVCSRCNQTYYCSREHQKVDFPEHKATCLDERSSQNSNGGKSNQSVKLADNIHGNRASGTFNFPEYEIYVEPESLDISESETKKNHGDFQDLVSEWEETAGTQDGAIVEDEDDGDDGDDNDDDNTYAKKDEDLTQKDYSEALGNKAPDPLYRKFLSRIRKGGGNQILRYSRWNGHQPLPVNSFGTPTAHDIPRCENCNGERQFEFQIMPQLLHYLRVDDLTLLGPQPAPDAPSAGKANLNFCNMDIDWGSLDVWTCGSSCVHTMDNSNGAYGAYKEEFCWRQPSPSMNQSGMHELGE